jgi:UDP-glucose 4-epimerase
MLSLMPENRYAILSKQEKDTMKVLVAGGAGWIGGVTSLRLQEAGHDVTVFDNLSTGFVANAKDAHFIQGDLTHRDEVAKLFQQPYDLIIHFAAMLDVGESMQYPRRYFDNNTMGSLNLIDEAVKSGVKRIIFSSSATVYGEPESVPITEEAAIRPINPYGYSKVMVEQLLASYEVTHGLEWLALRYFNPVGAYQGIGQNPQVSNIVPTALRAIKSGKPLQIFGNDYDTPDGTCLRDYVDVVEIADAHVRAAGIMMAGTTLNRPVNLGSAQGYSVLEMLAAIGKAAGRAVPAEFAGRRAGDAQAVVASSKLARELFGWSATTPLDEMVAAACEHSLNGVNPNIQFQITNEAQNPKS